MVCTRIGGRPANGNYSEGRPGMKAIIISDADARALLDQLKLEAVDRGTTYIHGVPPEHHDLAVKMLPAIEVDVHRRFHYVVTRWLQEMGADTLRR